MPAATRRPLRGLNGIPASRPRARATTNTPSLGAAQHTLSGLPGVTDERAALPALAYAVTYPVRTLPSPANASASIRSSRVPTIESRIVFRICVTISGFALRRFPFSTRSPSRRSQEQHPPPEQLGKSLRHWTERVLRHLPPVRAAEVAHQHHARAPRAAVSSPVSHPPFGPCGGTAQPSGVPSRSATSARKRASRSSSGVTMRSSQAIA